MEVSLIHPCTSQFLILVPFRYVTIYYAFFILASCHFSPKIPFLFIIIRIICIHNVTDEL
jgi:hypothetical protein